MKRPCWDKQEDSHGNRYDCQATPSSNFERCRHFQPLFCVPSFSITLLPLLGHSILRLTPFPVVLGATDDSSQTKDAHRNSQTSRNKLSSHCLLFLRFKRIIHPSCRPWSDQRNPTTDFPRTWPANAAFEALHCHSQPRSILQPRRISVKPPFGRNTTLSHRA